MPKKHHHRPQPHAHPPPPPLPPHSSSTAGIPKPPPIDVTHLPPNGPPPQSVQPAPTTPHQHQHQPQPPSKRPPPTYPRWAHRRDSPRLARTIHDLALFLSSLPLPLHKYTPRIAARLVARLLQRNNLMASNIAFDLALLFWRCIINIFFRSIQPRGAWRIPTDGPVIFVGAPHHNQFLDPLLLASEVRRGSGRRVAFLIAEKSIRRRFIGSAARLMQSIPVTRAADGAKPGKGTISAHPSGDPLLIQGHGTAFTSQLVPKGQIVLPKWTGYASAEVVQVISDTEVKMKKEWKDDRAKDALQGKKGTSTKKTATPTDGADNRPGTDYQCLPYVDQTEMYASVYEKLAEGGCLGIFPEGGSHDRTDLLPLKAGVVIMALGAMSANPGLRVRIVPVGLSYFHPDKFRSRAVVEFGAPLEVPQELVQLFEGGGDGKRKAVGDMMDLVFDGLKSVTVRAPDYETLMLIQAARRLYTPPGQHLTLPQVVELNRRFIVGYLKFKDDPRIQKLKADALRYNKMLGWAGLKDHQVERATRAGWRSLGLLGYRLGLLVMWGSLALPGVILNSPIIVLAKVISRKKAKEALAASQVKLKGRDVVGTWKVLVSLGVSPVLYLTYAIAATYTARRLRPNITSQQLALTPIYTMILLPTMSYSTLKISETALDIIKSLPPLFVSLLPGNQKVIIDLQNTRKQLTEEMQSLIDELAPQVWEDFESSRWRVLTPSSATPPPSTPDGRVEALIWKAKDARTRGTASHALSHPLAWADERLFGWRSGRPTGTDPSGKKRRLSSTERERPLTAAEFSGEHPTVEGAEAKGEAVEEDDDLTTDEDTIEGDEDSDEDEGDYEAIFSFLNPARLLSSRQGPLSPKSPRTRGHSKSGSRSRSGSWGLNMTLAAGGESFASKRNRSNSELHKMGMTSALPASMTAANPGEGTSKDADNTSPTSRRRRTHSLTESIDAHELAAASHSESQQRIPFSAASMALEAQKGDERAEQQRDRTRQHDKSLVSDMITDTLSGGPSDDSAAASGSVTPATRPADASGEFEGSELEVSYLGPPGTYSHQVTLCLFPNAVDSKGADSTVPTPTASQPVLVPCPTITAALNFALTSSPEPSRRRLALLPFRNSTYGPVQETTSLLSSQEVGSQVKVLKETQLKVEHALLVGEKTWAALTSGKTGGAGAEAQVTFDDTDLKKIRKVFSHEQALGQCDKFLTSVLGLPHGPESRVSVSSTAHAISSLAEAEASDADAEILSAALASEICATRGLFQGIKAVRRCVQDRDDNTTHFVLLERKQPSNGHANGSAEGKTAKAAKRVHLVGAPPPGPPIPKDDSHTDDEDEVEHDEEAETRSVASDAEEAARDGDEEQVEEVDLLANFEEGDENLELVHLGLKNADLRKLDLGRFSSSLKSVCLRQNFIKRLTDKDIGALHELRELDLYDNGLEKTYGDVLASCSNLESLDYSFNNIRHVSRIAHLAHLRKLYFVQNKIARVRPEDFDGPIAHSLISLELGGNKLRCIENLEGLTQLQELWLGKNKIPRLENLSSFSSLRILSIQSNRITKLENLEHLSNLEELYISHNGLEEISGLSALSKLRVLDVGGNKITAVQGLEGLSQLEEFWANDNQIASLAPLEAQLGPKACPKLETVYLEGNPVQRTEGPAYRRKIMLMLPQISQIDATFVKAPTLR